MPTRLNVYAVHTALDAMLMGVRKGSIRSRLAVPEWDKWVRIGGHNIMSPRPDGLLSNLTAPVDQTAAYPIGPSISRTRRMGGPPPGWTAPRRHGG
jgi:hypothetical protein